MAFGAGYWHSSSKVDSDERDEVVAPPAPPTVVTNVVTNTVIEPTIVTNVITNTVNNNLDYICGETLAVALTFTEDSSFEGESIDLIDNITAKVKIIKIRNNG